MYPSYMLECHAGKRSRCVLSLLSYIYLGTYLGT